MTSTIDHDLQALASANGAIILMRADYDALVEALRLAREALIPLVDFLPEIEAFVSLRARAANDVSTIMQPTKHFRLAHFQQASAATAAIDTALAKVAAP